MPVDSTHSVHLEASTSSKVGAGKAAATTTATTSTSTSSAEVAVGSTTPKLKATKSARRRKKVNTHAAHKPNPDQPASTSTSTLTERSAEQSKENHNKRSAPKKINKNKERKPTVPVATTSTSTSPFKDDSMTPPPPLASSWDDQLVAFISAQGSLAADDLPILEFDKLSLVQLDAVPTLEERLEEPTAGETSGGGKILSKKAQRDAQLKMRDPQGYERMMELRKEKRKERNKIRKEGGGGKGDKTTVGEEGEKKEIRIKRSAAFVAAVSSDEPEGTSKSAANEEATTQAEKAAPKAVTPTQTKRPAPVPTSSSTTPSIPTGPAAYRNAPPARSQPLRQQERPLIRPGPRLGPAPTPVPGSINPRFAHLPFHPHYRYPMSKTTPSATSTPATKSMTPSTSITSKSPAAVSTPMPTSRPAAVEDRLFEEGRAQSVVRLPGSSALPVVVNVPKQTTPRLSAPVEVTPVVPTSQSISQESVSTPTPTPTSVPVSLPLSSAEPAAPEPASIVAPPPQYSAVPTHSVVRNIPPRIQRVTTPPSAPISPVAVAPLPPHFYQHPQPSLYLPYYAHQPSNYYGSTTNEAYSPILSHGTATPPPPHPASTGRPSPFFTPARHSKALDIVAPRTHSLAQHHQGVNPAAAGQGLNTRQLPPYQYAAQGWAQGVYPSSSSRDSSRSPVTAPYPIQNYASRNSYYDDSSTIAYAHAQAPPQGAAYDPYFVAAQQQQQQQQQQMYTYANGATPTHQVQYHQGMSYYPASEGVYGGQYWSGSMGEEGEAAVQAHRGMY